MRFSERQRLDGNFIVGLFFLGPIATIYAYVREPEVVRERWWFWAGATFLIVLFGLVAGFWSPRRIGQLEHVFVDDEGLWLGPRLKRHLPAAEIGEVRLLERREANRASRRRRWGERRIPLAGCSIAWGTPEKYSGVLIERDHLVGDRTAWLLRTARPQELVAALEGLEADRDAGWIVRGGQVGLTDPSDEDDVEPDDRLDHLLARGQVDLDGLADVVGEAPLHLGRLCDEEVHLLGRSTQEAITAFETPRLATLAAPERQAALEAVSTLLLARGEVVVQEGALGLVGIHGLLARCRDAADLAGGLRRWRDGEVEVTTSVQRVRPTLFVLDDIDPIGLHDVSLQSLEDATAALVEHLDPEHLARDEVVDPPRRAETVDELEEELREVESSAVVTSHMQLRHRDAPGTVHAVTVHATGRGVFAVRGQDGESGWVELAELSKARLAEFVAAHLATSAPPASER